MKKLLFTFIVGCFSTILVMSQDLPNRMGGDTVWFKDNIKKALKFTYIDYDSASYYLKKANDISSYYPLSIQRAEYFMKLGYLKQFYGLPYEAEMAYLETYKIANHIHNDKYIIYSLLGQAGLYSDRGILTKAIADYLKIEQILLKNGKYNRLLFKVYYYLTIDFFKLNNLKKSSYYHQKSSLYLFSSADSLAYYSQTSVPLPEDIRYKNYLKSLQLTPKGDDFTRKVLYMKLAEHFEKTKNYEEALKYTNRALALSSKSVSDTWNYSAFNSLGNIYFHLKKYEKSRFFYNKALANAILFKKRDLEYDVLFNLSKLNQRLGKHKESLINFSSAQLIKDSLVGIEKQKLMVQLETEYEFSKKQKQIAEKELENKHQQERIGDEQKQKYVVFVLLCISILFLIWIIISFLRKNKITKELAFQKQEVESQANLLRQTNATKDKLFAMLSHDLRSPINNLASYLYLLDDEYQPPKAYIDKLRYSLDNVQLILNNLFEWAEFQITNSPPSFDEVRVDIIINVVLTQFQEGINDKSITVLNTLGEDKIWTDKNYAHIIVRNIISNAIKFTEKGGNIKISLENHERETCIIIEDSGVGVTKQKLDTIFNYPTSSAGTNNEKGTGLGLTLCKELMEKQNGNIFIESKIGVGTVVKMIFPFETSIE